MAKKQDNPMYKIPTGKTGRLQGVMWEVVVIGLLSILLVSILATQYVASQLEYQRALGEPLYNFIVPIYQPFSWIVWGWKFGDLSNPLVKHVFGNAYMGVTAGVLIGVFAAAYLNYKRSRNLTGSNEHLHGSAHWATSEEVKKTGLLGAGKGVYVGGYKDPESGTTHYLRHDGAEHVMAFAPTRSGKGIGLVLPTLLSWLHSVLVYDIKGECYALTAGWRKKIAGNIILKFEPTATDGSSVTFNPLEEIRIGTEREVSDVQNIVTMIVDPDGKGLNDHWAKTGHALLVGTVLHVLYAEPDKTLAGVANFLSDPSRTLMDTLSYMLNTEHDPDGEKGWTGNVHPVVAASARDMLNKSENESSGVLSTAMSFLTLYRDPIVAKNTAQSQFKVRDLMNADKPVSLYLVVSPSDKDRLKPLIRLIINQVIRSLTEKMEFKGGRSVAGYKHRLLLLIDEFPSLGKLDVFEEALAFIAGYGMKAYLIIQDIAQLWKAYGKDESIFSNCHVRIAYAPNKIETADLLSKMTGTTTIVKQSASYSGNRLQPMLGNISTNEQEISRSLLTPDEIMRLPSLEKDENGNVTASGDMLVFVAGHAPIYGTQILYFNDPTFNERAQIEAPSKSDALMNLTPAYESVIDVPGVIPEEIQPPVPEIEASYEAVNNPEPASDETPIAESSLPVAPENLDDEEDGSVYIEYAPDDLEDEASETSSGLEDSGNAEATDGDLPPVNAMIDHDVATDLYHAEEPQFVAPIATKKVGVDDDLLNEMKALSESGNDEFLGLFDDVLEQEEKPANKTGGAKQNKGIDLNEDMAAFIDEIAKSETHNNHVEL